MFSYVIVMMKEEICMTRKRELFIIFNLFRVMIVYLIIKLQKNKYDIIFEEVDYWLGLYSIKIKSKIMRLGYLLFFFGV